MPIAVQCGCGKQFRVPEEYAGKKIKCTSCGETRLVAATVSNGTAKNGTAKNGTAQGPAAPTAPPAPAAAPAVVTFQCGECNQPMQAKAEFAGKKTKCPACKATVTIPGPEEEAEEVEEVEEEETPRNRIQAGKPQSKKAGKRPVEDEADEVEEVEEIEEEAEEVEEEEERPRGRIQSGKTMKKAAGKRSRDEDDEVEEIEEEDEEEDDRPRKGKKSKKPLKKKRSGMGLLIGLAIGALLLVGGGVVALVLLMGGSGGADLAMIPADAQVFAVVQVKDVWKQPLVQEAMRQAKQKSGKDLAAEFEKESGLSPSEIERVTYAALDTNMDRWWVVITSTKAIDKAQSIEKMKLNPAELTHQGKTYYKSKMTPETVHFASSRMLISAPNEASMKVALEQLTGSRKATGGKLASAISQAGKHHVVVGFVVPPGMAQMGKMMAGGGPKGPAAGPDFTPLLEVQSGTVTADLNGNTIQYVLSGDFPDAAKAAKGKETLDNLKKAIPALALFVPDKQMVDELNKAADAMSISLSGNTVTLKSSQTIKNEDLAKAFAGMPMGNLGGGMPKPGPRPGPGPKPKPDPGQQPRPGRGGNNPKAGISFANYKKISVGPDDPPGKVLTRAEVEAILGPPTKNLGSQEIAAGFRSTETLEWRDAKATITVHFLNGKTTGSSYKGK